MEYMNSIISDRYQSLVQSLSLIGHGIKLVAYIKLISQITISYITSSTMHLIHE